MKTRYIPVEKKSKTKNIAIIVISIITLCFISFGGIAINDILNKTNQNQEMIIEIAKTMKIRGKDDTERNN